MDNQKITCPECGHRFEATESVKHEIEERLVAKFEKEKTAAIKAAKNKAAEEFGTRNRELEEVIKEKDAKVQEMRNQELELRASQRKLEEQKKDFELEVQRKLDKEKAKIIDGAKQEVEESQRFKLLEKDKTINDLQKSLADAQRKAQQGSQQNQGEVLELDLEARLKSEFPADTIEEVKKGQKGADIKQTVCNQKGASCGVLLWETKNGKWQPAWITKFKHDIREANASIGVIVSQEMPVEYGDMRHLETNMWVVKPRLAPILASALRTTILQVEAANRNSEGKDAKMEALYRFLMGPEFRNRIEAIVESFSILQDEIEKEKRAFNLKWARQEKAIRGVVDNTVGMYGDLQGITNRALPAINSLELPEPGGDIK